MPKSPHQQDIVAEGLKRFPGLAKKTLARTLYKENPEVWPTLNACYNAVRYATGAIGEKKRRTAAKSKRLRQQPHGKPGDAFTLKFPEGLRHHDNFDLFNITGVKRALLLYDVHLPYHDREALELAVQHGIDHGCDCVILCGDFMDFFACSRWEKDPRKRDLAHEIQTAREMLAHLRSLFPKKQIIWKLGNHEERWEKYLALKAPELLGVDDFQLENICRTKEHNIRVMSHRAPMVMGGKLNIIHGHEFGKTMTNPVNPARGLFLKGISNSICGHYHQTSSHSAKTIMQKPIGCWSSGCLCDMHPDYAPMNNWNHGFIEVQLDGDEDFVVHNYKIINGKVYAA